MRAKKKKENGENDYRRPPYREGAERGKGKETGQRQGELRTATRRKRKKKREGQGWQGNWRMCVMCVWIGCRCMMRGFGGARASAAPRRYQKTLDGGDPSLFFPVLSIGVRPSSLLRDQACPTAWPREAEDGQRMK
jgi:hypothetical protein